MFNFGKKKTSLLDDNKEALKKALDYNNDNLVDINDLIDCSNDIEKNMKAQLEQLKQLMNK